MKARHGRYRRNPVPHRPHRGAWEYERESRIRKLAVFLSLAPTVEDGLAELTNSGRAASTAARPIHRS